MNKARILFVLLLIFVGPMAARANPYMVVDVNTARILAHDRAFDRWYPASLTKLMTAYVTFQALQSGRLQLESPVQITAAATQMPPSKMGYKAGSVISVDAALKILMVKSANDVAVALAQTVAGSQSAFVDQMNAQAQRLGMIGSHFTNPHGLPDEQNYSTARDIALLSLQLRREFPQYAHYFSTPALDVGTGKKIENSNNLIGRFDGADGMKTGFICASGFNLSASATRNGRTIIAVVLGAERLDSRESLAAQLLSDGFRTAGSPQLTLATLAPYGKVNGPAPDLRPQICTAEAREARRQFRDDNGNLIINSPFINAYSPPRRSEVIRLLAQPPQIRPGQPIDPSQVPIPVPNPRRMQAF